MADPTDHPASITRPPASAAPGFGGPAPAAERPEEPLVYRPLSLWAVASFVLGAVYAGVFALMVVVSAWKGTPLQIGAWSLVFPIAGGVCTLLAWIHIQRSEGTRAGAKLAKWGGFLSLLSGVVFVAYGAAIYFAIANEATRFSDRWFELLSQGEIETAFLYTLEPSQRVGDDPKNLERMEGRYGTSESGPVGSLATFRQRDIVRLLQQAGKDATYKSRGVRSVDYQLKGYKVAQVYDISTPLGSWEVHITVHGRESEHKEYAGRQWSVMGPEMEMSKGTPTPLGDAIRNLHRQAMRSAVAWRGKLAEGQLEEAYLDTRAPAEREALRKQYQAGLLRPWLDPEEARKLYLPGYKDFLAGNLVRTDSFWATEPGKTELPAEARKLFRQPRQLALALVPDVGPERVAFWTREGDRFRIQLDFGLNVAPKYLSETRLVLETDAQALENAKATSEWQVQALQLLRARQAPSMPGGRPGMPGMPPRPGMAPMSGR